MMPSKYIEAAYWWKAAANARAMAATFNDPTARLAMLEIAIKYEAIARRAPAQQTDLNAGKGDEGRKAG